MLRDALRLTGAFRALLPISTVASLHNLCVISSFASTLYVLTGKTACLIIFTGILERLCENAKSPGW